MKSGNITRRSTFRWLAAAIASSSIPSYLITDEAEAVVLASPNGYGTDPDLSSPFVPWKRTMTEHQLQLTDLLADLILPATASAPAPSAIGISDFVDEWISAPYPEQKADRTIVLRGLAWIDAESRRCWEHPFAEIGVQRQEQVLHSMSLQNMEEELHVGKFFQRFRFIIVGGYYTTPEGFTDLGYIGNVALQSYPQMTGDEIAILDAELRKLGI